MKENRSRAVLEATLCMTRQCWEQGLVAQCLMELDEYEKLEIVVHDMVLRISADGRLCNVEGTPASTDSAFCIPATLFVGYEESRQDYIDAVNENIDYLLNRAERAADGTLFHIQGEPQIWADSAAFLPYALGIFANYEEALQQLEGIWKRVYREELGLCYHIWDEETQSYPRGFCWATGNGWMLTGVLRFIMILPDTYSEQKALWSKRFKALLNQILVYKTESDTFHDILDDPESFEEMQIGSMVAYCIYRAVAQGLLKDSYIATANRIRRAIHKNVSSNGLVEKSISSPDFAHQGTSVESQVHFLLMEHYGELREKMSE